jgi:hypothetical protein
MTNQKDSRDPSNPTNRESGEQGPVAPTAPKKDEVGEKSNANTNNKEDIGKELAREFRWVEVAQIGSNVVLAVVGIIALCIYSGQLSEMRKSSKAAQDAANASKSAADTAHDSLVLANRPWIKIKHRIVKPLNFDFVGAAGPAAIMSVEDTIENVGNSVALDVVSWEDVIPVDPDFSTTSARKRRDEWCNANKRFDPASSTTLNGTIMFPHDPFVQVSGMGPLRSTVNKAVEGNMDPLKKFVRGNGPNTLLGKVQFVMVGCVVYRSSFEPDGTRLHTTGFLYHLAEPYPGGAVQGFISPHGTADRLQLIAFPDGFFAY